MRKHVWRTFLTIVFPPLVSTVCLFASPLQAGLLETVNFLNKQLQLEKKIAILFVNMQEGYLNPKEFFAREYVSSRFGLRRMGGNIFSDDEIGKVKGLQLYFLAFFSNKRTVGDVYFVDIQNPMKGRGIVPEAVDLMKLRQYKMFRQDWDNAFESTRGGSGKKPGDTFNPMDRVENPPGAAAKPKAPESMKQTIIQDLDTYLGDKSVQTVHIMGYDDSDNILITAEEALKRGYTVSVDADMNLAKDDALSDWQELKTKYGDKLFRVEKAPKTCTE